MARASIGGLRYVRRFFALLAAVLALAPANAADRPLQAWPPLSEAHRGSGFTWSSAPDRVLDRHGLPRPPLAVEPQQTPVLRILLIDSGESYDPTSEAYSDALASRLEEAASRAFGGSVHVDYGGVPGMDSLRLRVRLRELVASLRPTHVLVMGSGYDRYINDPRSPLLPVADDQVPALLAGPGLPTWRMKELPHFLKPAADAGPLYVLERLPSSPTWIKSEVAQSIDVRDGALHVTSDSSNYLYQLLSPPVTVAAGKTYRLAYDIRVLAGAMSINVLDAVSDKWIAQTPLDPASSPTGGVAFTAPSAAVRLILANNNPHPAVARAAVRALALAEAAGEAEMQYASLLTARQAWQFDDARVLAFTRANLDGMVRDTATAGSKLIFTAHWRRALLRADEARRGQRQAQPRGVIVSLRQEEIFTDTYDDLIQQVANATGAPYSILPVRLTEPDSLASSLAHWLRHIAR